MRRLAYAHDLAVARWDGGALERSSGERTPSESPMLNGPPSTIFRQYDIRGSAESELSAETYQQLGQSFGAYARARSPTSTIAVGRDNRLTSAAFHEAFVRGVRVSGVSVIDISLCTTPMLYFAVKHWQLQGGGMITASHNPAGDNGLKLVGFGGLPLQPSDYEQIRRLCEREIRAPRRGGLVFRSIDGPYLRAIRGYFSLPRSVAVAVDPANGVTTRIGPGVLGAIGNEVDGINLTSDGSFPSHPPDPQDPRNLVGLGQFVRRSGSEIGFGWDGDGDRLGVVDETGTIRTPDEVLVVLAREYLRRSHDARVYVDVKTSLAAIRDIEDAGGEVVMGPTGQSIAKRIMTTSAIGFGGEGSAHYFHEFEGLLTDDAIFAAGVLTGLLARSHATASALFSDLRRYVTSPELRVPSTAEGKRQVPRAVRRHFAKWHQVTSVDGARITFREPEGADGWALVRASNTSDALSIRFEATTEELYERIRQRVVSILQQHLEVSSDLGSLTSMRLLVDLEASDGRSRATGRLHQTTR